MCVSVLSCISVINLHGDYYCVCLVSVNNLHCNYCGVCLVHVLTVYLLMRTVFASVEIATTD